MVLIRYHMRNPTSILECSKGIFKRKNKRSVYRQKSNSKDVNSNNSSMARRTLSSKLRQNRLFTPPEIVGKNDYLMSYIIKMIPNPEERKNLRAVSRRFYHLCTDKKNYIPFVKYLDRKSQLKKQNLFPKRWSEKEPLVMVSGNTLAVNLPSYRPSVTKYLKKHRNIIKMNNYKIVNLELGYISGNYLGYFDGLNCFENVETVTFNLFYIQRLDFKIFLRYGKLKPKTIRLSGSKESILDKQVTRFTDMIRSIPETVECLHLDCSCHKIEWIFKMAKYIPERHFDTLVLSQVFLANLLTLSNMNDKMITLTRCFKNVKLCLNQSLSYDVIRFFSSNSWIFNIDNGTKLIYYTKISLYKEPNIRFHPFIDELVPEPFINEEKFLSFEYFCLTTNDTWKKPPVVYRSPFPFIIGMMKNLITLEITMKIFNTNSEMEILIRELTPTLKNIKITNCEKMKKGIIEILSNQCRELNNISLECLNPTLIPIQDIINLFRNLKGLSIYFCYHSNMINTFTQLVGVSDLSNEGIKKWPEIDFLHIVFNGSQSNDKSILEEIDRCTPRKCGRFVVKHHPVTKHHSTEVSEVVFHKSPVFYTNFIKLFSQPCWTKK